MTLSPLSAAQRGALDMASLSYHEQLWDSERVLNYVYQRGISDETIKRFRLGTVKTPVEDSHRRFIGGLVIPNFCAGAKSHVVGIKVRMLEPDARPKYNQPSHQIARLFNLRTLNDANGWIAVVEGEIDAIVLEQAGFAAVGVPGANNWTVRHSRIFDGFDVVQFADNDDAGQALVRALSSLHTVSVRYPDAPAKDVNDQWLQMGQDLQAFRAWAKGPPK